MARLSGLAARGEVGLKEDKILMSAWVNVALDLITGTGRTFWLRIYEYFEKAKAQSPNHKLMVIFIFFSPFNMLHYFFHNGMLVINL